MSFIINNVKGSWLYFYFHQSSRICKWSKHFNIFINRSFTSSSVFVEWEQTHSNVFWKFSSSLINDHRYVSEIKHLISSFLSNDISNMNVQLKWERLRYEICNVRLSSIRFYIDYTKRQTKEKRKQQAIWGLNLKS